MSEYVYLRFGDWHPSEKSRNYAEGTFEAGVSAYEAFQMPDGRWRIAPRLTDDGVVALRDRLRQCARHFGEWGEAGEPIRLLEGGLYGEGYDGEPLIRKIRVLRELTWEDLDVKGTLELTRLADSMPESEHGTFDWIGHSGAVRLGQAPSRECACPRRRR